MAIINLRAVENQFEKDADYIEIQMDDMQYLRIRKQYKVFTINEGKKSQVTEDFMIIARVESFILGKSLDDALERSEAYIGAGADGIMIHSKEKDGNEIIKFCNEFQNLKLPVPLVVVPSSYPHITELDLERLGVNVTIYANHLLRSAYPSMLITAKSILENSRAKEASDEYCMPIKDIINLIPVKN